MVGDRAVLIALVVSGCASQKLKPEVAQAEPEDRCAMEPRDQKMVWKSCAPGIDCHEVADPVDGKTHRHLLTPTTGPVVMEAHLVTEDEGFGAGWPSSSRDQIDRHYRLSVESSDYRAERGEPWAPAGEGGSKFGQGSTGAKIPADAEAWYITMYWRDRPSPGTRMIVRNPANGRAVVAAAGYETGPGSNRFVAGVVEEIHLHLDSLHRDELEIGFARDQTLPYGPIVCATD